MERTKLSDRPFADYTKGEEIFNMVSHIIGGILGITVLVLCVITSALHRDAYGVVGSAIYGASMVILYTVSSIYHGLNANMGKKVMQVIDHCTIYLLIAGTYTPILFTAIRRESVVTAWVLFGIEWGFAALAGTLTAVDLKKYNKFSMICYIGMGWGIIFAAKTLFRAVPIQGILLLVLGGVSYTIGAAIYGLGKRRYMHSVFHLFVVLGSLLQFLGILLYML